jgi:hypothetical protein
MVGGPVSPATPETAPRSGDIRSLVLRAWREPGAPPHLRARVVDISPGRDERQIAVTTSVDEACRTVRSWLETLLAQGTSQNGDGAVTRK